MALPDGLFEFYDELRPEEIDILKDRRRRHSDKPYEHHHYIGRYESLSGGPRTFRCFICDREFPDANA